MSSHSLSTFPALIRLMNSTTVSIGTALAMAHPFRAGIRRYRRALSYTSHRRTCLTLRLYTEIYSNLDLPQPRCDTELSTNCRCIQHWRVPGLPQRKKAEARFGDGINSRHSSQYKTA